MAGQRVKEVQRICSRTYTVQTATHEGGTGNVHQSLHSRNNIQTLDSSQLNFIVLCQAYTPLPAIIGRLVTVSSGIVLTNRLHHCIQRHILTSSYNFILSSFFFFFWVTRYSSMQDGCNSSRNSPPASLITGFHNCCPQVHHNMDGPRRNCKWLSGGSTSAPSVRSQNIFAPNKARLLAGGLNVNNIAMRERRMSYPHQYLATGAGWKT